MIIGIKLSMEIIQKQENPTNFLTQNKLFKQVYQIRFYSCKIWKLEILKTVLRVLQELHLKKFLCCCDYIFTEIVTYMQNPQNMINKI